MIQVWRCDHCSYLSQNAKETRLHEYECEWNIKNKTCQTCEHRGNNIEGNATCSLKIKIKDRFSNVNCSKWQIMFNYLYELPKPLEKKKF